MDGAYQQDVKVTKFAKEDQNATETIAFAMMASNLAMGSVWKPIV